MSYMFELNTEGKAVLNKNCLQLIPKLRFLTDEEVLFTILALDYYSPYAKFPDIERFRKAKIHAFGNRNVVPWEKQHIKEGMEAYESLQYDRRREIKKTYERKIEMLQNTLMYQTKDTLIVGTLKSIDALTLAIKNLEADIDQNNSAKNMISGKGNLSLIEEMQKNRNSFKNLEHPLKAWDPIGEINEQE